MPYSEHFRDRENRLWIAVSVDDKWTALCRMTPQDGAYVLAELRVVSARLEPPVPDEYDPGSLERSYDSRAQEFDARLAARQAKPPKE